VRLSDVAEGQHSHEGVFRLRSSGPHVEMVLRYHRYLHALSCASDERGHREGSQMQEFDLADLIGVRGTDEAIPLFRVLMSPDAKHQAARVLDSGYVGQGPEVEAFERELAEMLRVPDESVVTVNSCTSAISLALHLVGVGPGDEVITSPMTCSATNCPVVTRGARIVWADVDALTGLISAHDVANKVGPRTRAVIGVNWGGRSCDYGALRRAAPGVPIIEDAAQRSPTEGWTERAGAREHGDYVCLSFQAIKFLTTCDGGALVCAPSEAARARLLRWYGLDRRLSGEARVEQVIADAGYKYHMNDLAAVVGRANIPYARWALRRHRDHAAILARELGNAPGVRIPGDDGDCHYWLQTILVEEPRRFIQHLASRGVSASQVHRRNDVHPAFGPSSGPLPGVDHFATHEVAIPVGWWLEERDLARIVDVVIGWAS
jgi:dTDP-4-amino-4,6-dideoxygalactose transaminase